MRNSTPDDTGKTLQAEQRAGVYLLAIHSEFEGYTIRSRTDQVWVERVTVNGNYIGTSGSFETECDGFELDGDTADLQYTADDTDTGTESDSEKRINE